MTLGGKRNGGTDTTRTVSAWDQTHTVIGRLPCRDTPAGWISFPGLEHFERSISAGRIKTRWVWRSASAWERSMWRLPENWLLGLAGWHFTPPEQSAVQQPVPCSGEMP